MPAVLELSEAPRGRAAKGCILGFVGEVLGERTAQDQVLVSVRGHLDEQLGLELLAVLDAHLAADVTRVMVDLSELDSYDILGREQLARAHTRIAATTRRSAFVSEHSRIRGMVLLAMRESRDHQCRPTINREQAQQWLDGTQSFIEQAATGMSKDETL